MAIVLVFITPDWHRNPYRLIDLHFFLKILLNSIGNSHESHFLTNSCGHISKIFYYCPQLATEHKNAIPF